MSQHPTKLNQTNLDQLCINTLRFLSVDAIQNANSGHPGLPLGAAPAAYVLWTRFLKHNPLNPIWFNRDRFILSAGHGSMLLYSLLHLTGYPLSLEQIKLFRQFGSQTPGHPERHPGLGIEVTTGPLGQGFANGVGLAIAEAHLAARFNRPGFDLISHYTYALVSDGDLMEGVASEAASLAGDLGLGKLVYLYDNNHVTLSASTELTFREDVARRFEAYDWHVQSVEDGNDLVAIDLCIQQARLELNRPSLILVRTHLGYGSPHKQDTFEAHGSPLGEEEVRLTKQNLGWPVDPPFYIPEKALTHFRREINKGQLVEADWNLKLTSYARQYPNLAAEMRALIRDELPADWKKNLPVFPADPKGIATRVASGKIMNAIAGALPGLIGGSADLDPSTFTALNGQGDFQSPQAKITDPQGSSGGGWNYTGRNIHFGVREHSMGAILNGLAAHGGLIPYGATFLIFSDYMRPPIRLAALMKLHVIFIFTHDSIGLGEDGPTHQPVEQLAGLRSVPGLLVLRPGDANETTVAWQLALETRNQPVALVLSRQAVPTLDRSRLSAPEGLRQGGYILADPPGREPDLILIASGSEVSLALAAREKLEEKGVLVRVVSMPGRELFSQQPLIYREQVLPSSVSSRLVIEAAHPMGWERFAGDQGDILAIEQFGASAPGAVVMREYGFTVDNVIRHAEALLAKHKA